MYIFQAHNNKRPENEKTIIIIFEVDHNSPGQTPLWWVIPMMMIPMIDRNNGTLNLSGVSNYELKNLRELGHTKLVKQVSWSRGV